MAEIDKDHFTVWHGNARLLAQHPQQQEKAWRVEET